MKSMEDILNLIEEEDVEFIRLQFSDAFGNLKNIAVTPGQLDRVMAHQYSVNGAALFDDLCEFEEELYLYPDLDTFVILPWRPQHGKVAKIICDLYDENGVPFDQSPRAILQKVIRRGKEEGYTFIVNPECEFFLFHTDDNGTPTTITHEKAGYLDVGPLDLGENARREMVLTLEDMGFEIESSHHEKAPAQHEIDFTQAEALDTADALMNFKFAIRSTAKRFGLYATFMPKPRREVSGSGMHVHFALYKDGIRKYYKVHRLVAACIFTFPCTKMAKTCLMMMTEKHLLWQVSLWVVLWSMPERCVQSPTRWSILIREFLQDIMHQRKCTGPRRVRKLY